MTSQNARTLLQINIRRFWLLLVCFCIYQIASQAQAQDALGFSGDWVAETRDENEFFGSVVISVSEDDILMSYTFVYDQQVISSNLPSAAHLEMLGDGCYRAMISGSFLTEEKPLNEIILCHRGDTLFWQSLDRNSSLYLIPRYATFSR